jgi:protein-tyrosine phosphatase
VIVDRIGVRLRRTPMLDSRSDPMAQVLLVCTGNICRSPMAEGMLRSALERRLGDGAPRVASAGVIARDGAPATPEAVEAAADLGVDISGHSARRLRPEHVRAAGLIVGMAAEHREEIVALVPQAEARTFTLKELVRRLEASDAMPRDTDVADPLGLSLEGYRAVAREIENLCERLASGLFDGSPIASALPD